MFGGKESLVGGILEVLYGRRMNRRERVRRARKGSCRGGEENDQLYTGPGGLVMRERGGEVSGGIRLRWRDVGRERVG